MKNILLVFLFFVQSCVAFAQNCCANDTIVREIQLPLTENDTETVFQYFNNEWIVLPYEYVIPQDSIQTVEIKKDEYGNRAIFYTVSSDYLNELKAEARKIWPYLYPQCEFPGGNGKLKEWLDANIQIPEGYMGSERVSVQFYVQPDGTITDPKIIRPSKNDAANEEALRLVSAFPKFRVKYYTPKKSRLTYVCPITFTEPGTIFIRGEETEKY